MIEGFAGRPGSGKTYTMTARALKEMKRGHRVFSNYWIEGATQFGPEDLLDLPPGFIVLDEAHLWLSSRAFHKLPHSWLMKLSQTRKAGWHLLWSAQHPSRVDKALRDVTHVLWWCHAWPASITEPVKPRFFWARGWDPHKAKEHEPDDPKQAWASVRLRMTPKIADKYDTLESVGAALHLEGDQYQQISQDRKAAANG